jgi:hypothetical protein
MLNRKEALDIQYINKIYNENMESFYNKHKLKFPFWQIEYKKLPLTGKPKDEDPEHKGPE